MSKQYTDVGTDLIINKLSKAKYDDLVQQGLINDNELYMVTDGESDIFGSRCYEMKQKYMNLGIVDIEGSSTSALTCLVDNMTISTIELSSNEYPIVIYTPVKQSNYSRDFKIRVEFTGQTPPNVFFRGYGDESCTFESMNPQWQQISNGVNIIEFIETKNSNFLTQKIL